MHKVICISAVAISAMIANMAVSPRASGQFIRLAGFDFSAKTGVDAVYTTNVEQERKSEATADREDYYLVWWLGLDAIREIGPSTKLDLSTGMAIEKHFNRPDLDNSDRPFARGRIRIDSQLNRYLLFASASYERTSESTENVFVPGGGKRRQVGTTIEYLGGFDWEYNDWSAGASYTLTQDRYDSEDFKPDEQDEDKILAYIYWKMFENLGLGYKYEREKVDFINRDDGEGDWLTTQTITLDWLITLIQRPHLTYSLGIEKEDTDEEDGEWELTHTFMVTDEWDLSPTLRLSGFASYKIEETPEEDEVELQYGIFLDHVLSQRSSQSLYATRKPVKTLGSTLDTAETVYGYLFKTIDFLIYDLSFNFSVKYTINEPVVGDTEKLWEYMASLEHRRQLTPNLSRTLRYTYTLEESNLESENLDEHEVRLSFEYVF